MKGMLRILCILGLLYPICATAQESARFRQGTEAQFRFEDALSQQLYALAAQGARASQNTPVPGIQNALPSGRERARYVAALSNLKLNRLYAADSAIALLGQVVASPMHDRLSLAIAQHYFLQGKLAAAVPYYEQAGIANLSNREIADAKFELAYSYFNSRQFEQASTLFAVMKEVPGKYYSPGNYYYGLLAYNAGDYDAALKSFDRINNEPLYRPVVPYYMAEIYYFKGDREKALAEALRLIKRSDKLYYDNELHLLAAQCLFEAGRYGDALPYFEYYYEHTQKIRKEELYEMAYCYYRVGEWKSAIDKFKPLSAAQDSLGQTAMYLLGDSYLKTGDKQSARNAFGICAAMPFSAGQREASLLLHAKLSYELGFMDDASRSVRTLLEDFPNGKYVDDGRLLQSQLYLETNNYKDAYDALLNTRSAASSDYDKVWQRAAYGYAVKQLQNQRLGEASELLSASLSHPATPGYTAAALFWKGELAYRMHQYDSAQYYGEQYLAMNDAQGEGRMISPAASPSHAWLTIGYAAMELKDFPRAQRAFKNAQTGGSIDASNNASLREADAYFMQKDFAKAAPIYATIAASNGADADYARLQSAIIAGLRGDNAEKTRLLQSILNVVPSSPYATEARYELGVVQLADAKYEAAVATFQPLVSGRAGSAYTAKALLKIGTAYQQLNNDDKALEAYNRIIKEYRTAPEREDALTAMKSIYIERNQPDAYSRLLQENSLPQATDAELDAAYYNAAEAQYAAGKWAEAQSGFARYLQVYPMGVSVGKARYYLANSLYNQKRFREAKAQYDTVLRNDWGNFSEESARKAAEIAVADTLLGEAAPYYGLLAAHTANNAVKVSAYTALMRAAAKRGDVSLAASYADTLNLLENVSPGAKEEASLYIARRSMATGNNAAADTLLRSLQGSTNGAVGAEARYYAAQNLMLSGKLKEAEDAASKNIKLSAGYEYWVVKTYLLLGDILIKQKDYFNAKATLQSIAQHTKIAELKAEALRKLEEVKGLENSKLSNE